MRGLPISRDEPPGIPLDRKILSADEKAFEKCASVNMEFDKNEQIRVATAWKRKKDARLTPGATSAGNYLADRF
jgi:hypothetical protein